VLALEILTVLAPLLLGVAIVAVVLRRRGPDQGEPGKQLVLLAVATLAFGALSFVPAWLFEGWVENWAGLDEHARTSDAAGFLYAFLVAAPIEQGLKLLAVLPAWRSPRLATAADGVLFASLAALGFVSAHNAELFSAGGVQRIDLVRALLAVPAHVFFAASWGFVLGRQAARGGPRRLGGRAFDATLVLAMLFNGVYDHIAFGRGEVALLATLPILACMAVIVAIAARSLGPEAEPAGSRFSIAPPTIGDVRAALWRAEQPVMFAWIPLGALVMVGVITASLAGAVMLGQRIGVDFAAVDRPDAAGSAAPLVLLGLATLSAFPVGGYLVARGSASRTVLEAAIAAALAVGGALVLLGLAAPVAVVFAIAFAPVALGLACAGAWMGVRR
jgi:RsiW-degrading membrane proteinase PrsW (M82 family)